MAMENLMLVCKYEHEAVPISRSTCTSFEDLAQKVCAKWVNLQNEHFNLSYSTPGYDKFLLRDNEEFTCMLTMASIFNLKFLEINVSAPFANKDRMLQIAGNRSESYVRRVDDISCSSNMSNERSIIENPSSASPLLSAYWASGISHVGQGFQGGRFDFRDALLKYSIERGFEFSYKRNEKNYVSAYCKNNHIDGCPWYVGASLCRSNNYFIIRQFVNTHTCKARLDQEKSKRLSSKVVAGLITKPLGGKKKKWDPNDVVDYLQELYGHEINYPTAYHALDMAKIKHFGNSKDSYQQLLWYTRATRELNPGSNIMLELDNEDNRFHRIFISWAACIKGFRYIRPMIFLDGTFLKSKYKGCLLAATGKNANQELYPVAYAIVDAENGDNWLWFLKCLRDALQDDRDITFISDRHAGLLEALPKVFPNSANFFCNRHLKDNLKGKFNGNTYKGLKDRIVKLFDKCAYAPEPASFSQCLAEFLSVGGRIAQNFLDGLPYKNWTNAYSDGLRYDEMTTNAIESFNSWIRVPREFPSTQCIDMLRQKLMDWFVERKTEAVIER